MAHATPLKSLKPASFLPLWVFYTGLGFHKVFQDFSFQYPFSSFPFLNHLEQLIRFLYVENGAMATQL